MATIDKLKLDYYDFDDFRIWVLMHHPKLLGNMYNPLTTIWASAFADMLPVANFTHRQDCLLLWRCPLPFVRRYLEEQCGMKTRWYHRLFWTRL